MDENNNIYTDVNVWDWQTRVLHWINAILIITLVVLALSVDGMKLLGVEKPIRRSVKEIHAYIGYFFILTLTLRVIWGFVGNSYARWLGIIPYKKEQRQAIWVYIRWYLSGLKEKPPIVIGHNPLGSFLYIVLFIMLIVQAGTGLLLAGLEFNLFPASLFFRGLGKEAKESFEDTFGEIHEFGLWFILFFIVAHIFGLIIHEVKEKTGLFSSMIHGKKYFSGRQKKI